MDKDPAFEKLKTEISADLQAVRPLARPWLRALVSGPAWLALTAFVVLALGLRLDYPELGHMAGFGLTFLQYLAAYALFLHGLRTVVPGLADSNAGLVFLVGSALAIHWVAAWVTLNKSPVSTPPGQFLQAAAFCWGVIVLLSLLLIGLTLGMASRGLFVRPGWTGVLLALGSGLGGEAAWRMHCSMTDWSHVLPAHSGALLALVVAGFLLVPRWARHA